MDKQKQIEEMAWVLQNDCNNGYCNNDCEFYNDKTFKKAFDKRLECEYIKRAKILYAQGYRKIPEGAVVLTGTETEERLDDLLIEFDEMSFYPATLIPNAEECAREWKEKLIYAIGQLVNKKVGKFAERLKSRYMPPLNEWDEISIGSLFYEIDEICKELTASK